MIVLNAETELAVHRLRWNGVRRFNFLRFVMIRQNRLHVYDNKPDRDETDCETETRPRGLASMHYGTRADRRTGHRALAPGPGGPRDPDTRADEQLIP